MFLNITYIKNYKLLIVDDLIVIPKCLISQSNVMLKQCHVHNTIVGAHQL